MSTLKDFSDYGQLAFASYGELARGIPSIAALKDAGMSPHEAERFASEWSVVDQLTLASGLSATVFQNVTTGLRTLSIRGTETNPIWAATADLSADYLLAVGIPNEAILQFRELQYKTREWLENGTLASGFSVTGHSLGGYLAGGIGLALQNEVSTVYTYNAPGVAGALGGGAYQLLKSAFGLENVPLLPNTFNLRGARGLSLIAGLGAQLAPPIKVEIEGASGLGLENHVISKITDSLEIYALLSKFNPNQSLDRLSELIAASSIRDVDTFERTLFPLLNVRGIAPIVLEDRDSLFEAISRLETEAARGRTFLEIKSLVGLPVSEIFNLSNGAEGSAYRYALQGLEPYVVLGEGGTVGALDGLTSQYLADRAEMLYWKNQWFISDGQGLLAGEAAESRRFSGRSMNDSGEEPIAFTVRGRRIEAVGIPVLRSFGTELDENLTGGDTLAGDHLYGGGGNDTLDGQGGTDYLEGNSGDDTLQGGFDDDVLVGGEGFDTYVYNQGDDFDTLTDADGSGRVLYDGRVLGGGTKVGEGAYRDSFGVEYLLLDDGTGGQFLVIDGSILVEDYKDGDLGIVLNGDTAPPESPESTASHSYFDSAHPADFEPGDGNAYGFLLNLYGSRGDDYFATSGEIDVFGRTGNDVAVVAAGATYGNAIDLGAGDDRIDASGSIGVQASAMLAGGGGADYILGGSGSDAIWGDNYLAISQELLPGATLRSHGTFRVDGLDYNAELGAGESVFGFLPAGYGIFSTITEDVLLGDAASQEVADEVMVPDGSMIVGTLSEALAAVLGDSPGFGDYIDAGDGDDSVVGGSGSDVIVGGTGADVLVGDYGAGSINAPSYRAFQRNFGDLASLFGDPGDDLLDGGEGDDRLVDTDGGDEFFFGGSGDDFIESREDLWSTASGAAAHNTAHGDEGDDTIFVSNATGGMDVVDGGEGNDFIEVHASRWSADNDGDGMAEAFGASEGRAIVFGGTGNDILRVFADEAFIEGGNGDDDYTVSGNRILISDSGGNDTLHLGLFDLSFVDASMEAFPAIDPEDEAELDAIDQFSSTVVLRDVDDLMVVNRFSQGGAAVSVGELRIEGWFGAAGGRIERIVNDGAEAFSLTPLQLESWGGLHQGGGGADELVYASELSDRAFGGGGNDLIFTGNGADRISGGRGDDQLLGGAGNDTYYYAEGDGHDSIEDVSGFDEIRYGPGFVAADVSVSLEDSGLVLTTATGRIDVIGATRADLGIEQLRFADGTTVSIAGLVGADPIPPDVVDANAGGGGSEAVAVTPERTPVVDRASSTLPAIDSAPIVGQESSLPQLPVLRVPPAVILEAKEGDALAPAGARDVEAAPLDLVTLLRAVRDFEAPATSSDLERPSAERVPVPAVPTALTSWALTNALLEFHLGRTSAGIGSDGTGEAMAGTNVQPGFGLGAGSLGSGLAAFGEPSQRLQTFSGLQEGLARLG